MPLTAGYNGVGHANSTQDGANRTVIGAMIAYFAFMKNGVATAPVAAASNNIMTTLAGPNTTTATLIPGNGLNGSLVSGSTLVTDFARNVVITVTHASAVVALSGVITGKRNGKVITETWSVTAGTTSKTFTGKKAFNQITSITITAASDASADSVVIGTGTVFGLPCRCSCPSAVKETLDGSIVTNGTVVAGVRNSATADHLGTYSPNTAPDGSHKYEVWFLANDPAGAQL